MAFLCCRLVDKLCPSLFDWTVARQAHLSMGLPFMFQQIQ